MHSDHQEEHESVKEELIEDYSEVKSDPEPFRLGLVDMIPKKISYTIYIDPPKINLQMTKKLFEISFLTILF